MLNLLQHSKMLNKKKKILTRDVLHLGQAAVKSVHGLQKLSSMSLSLEWRQDQHLAVW